MIYLLTTQYKAGMILGEPHTEIARSRSRPSFHARRVDHRARTQPCTIKTNSSSLDLSFPPYPQAKKHMIRAKASTKRMSLLAVG